MSKLSHEKAVHLSHVIIDALQQSDTMSVEGEPNDIRNRLLGILREELRRDAQIEDRARRKISSQRRHIPEGSAEWDILFRKYYEEEMSRLGTS